MSNSVPIVIWKLYLNYAPSNANRRDKNEKKN